MSYFHSLLGSNSRILILGIDTIPSIRVPLGTSFASINFSDYSLNSVLALTQNGTFVTCTIAWAQGSYNSGVAATYTLSGTLTPPVGYSVSGITPQISVQVLTIPAAYTSILNRGIALSATLPTPICQGDEIRLYNAISASLATMDGWWNCMTDGSRAYARINWKNPGTNDLTEVGALTYTPRVGFTGNGTTGYLDPGAGIALSGLTNYTLNSGGFGGYIYDSGTTGFFGGCVAAGARLTFSVGSRAFSWEINGNTNPAVNDSFSGGWYHAYKTAAGTISSGKNSGTLLTGVTDNSVARPTVRPYLLARNNNGTADIFTNATISCFWIGAPLDSNLVTLGDAYQTFVRFVRPRATYGAVAPIGEKINTNFAVASIPSTFQTFGSGTWTFDGTKLVATNGSTTYANRLLYKYGTSSEKWRIDATVTAAQAPGAATPGIGIGMSDFSGINGERSIIFQFNLTNLASGGKASIHTWNGTTDNQVAISSTAITVAQNDVFNLVLEKTISAGQFLYTATATRISDGASVSTTYSTLIGDSTGDAAIFNLQTTANNITRFIFTDNEEKNHGLCLVGDSLTHGVASTSTVNRWAANLGITDYVISAGSGDLTQDVLGVSTSTVYGKMSNILELNAKTYALVIGGNDVAAGSFSSTLGQNYLRMITNTILNEGHKVIFITPPPRASDLSAITTYTLATFPNNTTISAGWTACKNGAGFSLLPAYDNGDGVHMNNAGHAAFATAVAPLIPVLY